MPSKFIERSKQIVYELEATIHRLFKEHFEDTNTHPLPLGINYSRSKSGEWLASVSLDWQRKSDFKHGTRFASFEYNLREKMSESSAIGIAPVVCQMISQTIHRKSRKSSFAM